MNLGSALLGRVRGVRAGPWHGRGDGRWESAFGFKKKILRFIERFEALCQHPVPGDPELHPFANVPQNTKDVILTCLTQWCASLATLPPLEK